LVSDSLFMLPPPPRSTPSPYTTLFRSDVAARRKKDGSQNVEGRPEPPQGVQARVLPFDLGHVHPHDPERRENTSSIEAWHARGRSEGHTSELQSREKLVCRLLLDEKTS